MILEQKIEITKSKIFPLYLAGFPLYD